MKPASALAVAYAGWRALPAWQHGLAIGLILLASTVRYFPALASPDPLGDELAQEIAFQLAAGGHSPYLEGAYVYPPSLLRIGAVLHRLPLRSPFLPLRCASLLGLAVVLWCASAWLAWKPWQRVSLAVAYPLLSPGVRQGVEFGNLTFAVAGLIVLALYFWERLPVASGLLLGASLLLKPLAPAACVALAFHRPRSGHRHWLAAAVALLAAGVPLAADPEIGAFLRHGSHAWVVDRTVSLHRFLSLAHLAGAASLLTILLLVGVAIVAHLRVHEQPQLLAVALAGCVTVSPVVWNHTLVLTLPLQAMAIALVTARWRAANAGERRWRGWEAVGIGLAVAALTFAEGATGIDDRGVALQIFATLPPALAPAILATYVLRFHDTRAEVPRAPRAA